MIEIFDKDTDDLNILTNSRLMLTYGVGEEGELVSFA
jgi:hypothetical protein